MAHLLMNFPRMLFFVVTHLNLMSFFITFLNYFFQPLSLPGRVLPPPKLLMNHTVQPHHGVWDFKDARFFRGAVIRSWIVFNYFTEGVNRAEIK